MCKYINTLYGLDSSEDYRVYEEKFEDTKGIIRIRHSKNIQHNDQKKKYKRTNNDLQHTA